MKQISCLKEMQASEGLQAMLDAFEN